MTESNHQIAIDLLEKRFGRKDFAINGHMTRLPQEVGALRRLYDDVVKNVRCLEALGVQQKQFSALLRMAIDKRLPHELVLR